MEPLVLYTVDQIGLEGPQGCTVSDLVKLLSEQCPLKIGLATYAKLTPEHLERLWRQLLTRKDNLSICRLELRPPSEKGSDSSGEDEGGKSKKRKRKSKKDEAEEKDQNVLVPVNDEEEFRDWATLDRDTLRVVASQTVRDASLGLYSEQLSTFSMSDHQRFVLEFVGRRRQRGALRTELTKRLRMEPTRFHYIINLLEGRGVVVSSPILHNNETARDGHAMQNTSIIHLLRYAPKLAKGEIFKEVVGGPLGGVYGISNDNNKQLKRICERLSRANQMTLVETDLKQDLGFRQSDGHRAWRKLRASLENSGHVKVFAAILAGKKQKAPKNLVRLLKPFNGDKDEEEEEEDPAVGTTACIAELSFDWQVIKLVVQAGKEGIFKHRLCRALGISMKRMVKRLDEIRGRFGIIETDEQDHKQIVKKWCAPDSMLEREERIKSPPRPERGFTAAVVSTIESIPTVQQLQSARAEDAKLQLASLGSRGEADAAATDVEMTQSQPPGPAGETERSPPPALELTLEDLQTGLPVEPTLARMLQAEPSPEPPEQLNFVPDLPVNNDGPQIADDLLDNRNVLVTNVGVVTTTNTRKEIKFTTLAQERYEILLAKVEAEGFVLRSDLHNVFTKDLRLRTNNPTRVLDRKTMMRIVDRGIMLGKMQHFCLNVPPQKNGYQVERIYIIVKAGLQVEGNPQLIREIRRVSRERLRERVFSGPYRKGDDSPVKLIEKVDRLVVLPHQSTTKTAAEEEDEEETAATAGTVTSAMWENGFIQARMVRARMLHQYICQLIGLAGYHPDGVHNAIDEYRPSGRREGTPEGSKLQAHKASGPLYNFFDTQPGEGVFETEKRREEREAVERMAEQHSGLFTYRAMWTAMPLDLYCQCVGTSNCHPTVQALIAKAPKMGELVQQEHQAIVDMAAKKRMNGLLDILVRLGLVRTFMYSGNTFCSRPERSVYLVLPDVSFEEPKSVADEHTKEEGCSTVQFDLRAEEDLGNYWDQLEYACLKGGSEMCKYTPGRQVPELNTFKGWSRDRMMPMRKWMELRNRILKNIEEFGWEECKKAAKDLDLEYEQVHRIGQHMRMREGRQRSKKDPTYKLPHLPLGHSPRPAVHLRSVEDKRKVARLRYKQSKLEWRQQLPSKAKCPTLQRPWDPSEETLKKKKKNDQLELETISEDEEEEEVEVPEDKFAKRGPTAVPNRLSSRRFLHKKFLWTPEEDRFVLQGYVKWHAVMGFREKAFRSQQRPMKGVNFKERQGFRRIKEFAQSAVLGGLLKQLNAQLEGVWKRAHQRGEADLAVMRLAKQLQVESAAMKKAAIKQRNDARRAKKAGVPGPGEDEYERYRPAYGALVVPFPKLKAGTLFAMDGEKDQAAHARISEIIEDIVAMAPRRVDENNPTRRQKDFKRKLSDGMFDTMPPTKKRVVGDLRSADDILSRRPVRGGFRTLEEQLQRMVSKGAQSRTKLLLEDEEVPTAATAAAAELIKSLLSMNENPQGAAPDCEVALVRRFTETQISAAFAHLRRRNFVYHGGSRKPFSLAVTFKTALQVLELPSDIFEEAALAVRSMDSSDTGVISVSKDNQEVSGGLIAEILGMVVADTAALSLPAPQDVELSTQPESSLDELMPRSIKAVEWEITAELTQVEATLPQGLHMRPEKPLPAPASLFDPVAVLKSEAVREKAMAACCAAAGSCGVDETILKEAHSVIKEAAAEGPSAGELAAKLSKPLETVQNLLPLLLRYGLICRVPGYSEWAFVASESSASFYSDPEGLPSPQPSAAAPSPELEGASRSSQEQSQQPADNARTPMEIDPAPQAAAGPKFKGKPKLKPPKERGARMLAPWLDHKGRLNEVLWRQLVSRLMGLVVCLPGIKEEDLVADMGALTPCSTRRLIDILLAQELLMVQEAEASSAGPPRLFGGPAPKSTKVRHFFVDVRAGFDRIQSVVPGEAILETAAA